MKLKVGDKAKVVGRSCQTLFPIGSIVTIGSIDADGDYWSMEGGCCFREADLKFDPGASQSEYTGGSVNYYRVKVESPTSPDVAPYEAECNDIIEALGMNYAEGNAFKAIWRSCAARQGKAKRGYDDGLYDAEKVVFFGQRMVLQAKGEK